MNGLSYAKSDFVIMAKFEMQMKKTVHVLFLLHLCYVISFGKNVLDKPKLPVTFVLIYMEAFRACESSVCLDNISLNSNECKFMK